MDKFLEETQIRISMTKDATGTAFTVSINGAKNCSTYLNLAESAAKRIPAIQAAKKPPIILNRENAMDNQNSPVQASSNNLWNAVTGETNRIFCPMIKAQICHMISHTATAQNLIFPGRLFFLGIVIEIVCR